METDRTAKRKILRESYGRLVLVNMIVLLATNVCGFIDNVVISNILGQKALTAVGFFSPVSAVTGLVYVLIIGTVILCGNYIGGGEQKKVTALFTSVFLTIAACCTVFSLLLVVFQNPVSMMLGARGDTLHILADYIAGFAPGIVFSSLSAFLLATSSFNNEISRSYAATAAMFFVNLVLDLLLAKPFGTLGIGLASTLSCLISFLIMIPGYVNHSVTIHFEKGVFDKKEVLEAAGRGLPALLFTAGIFIKNSLINYTMLSYAGNDGIAVANVLGSVCGIFGTVIGGFTNAESTLLSLSYGEEDREGYVDVFNIAVRAGMICTVLLVVCMIIFNSRLSGVFFVRHADAYDLGKKMFMLGFLFFPLNLVINLLMNSYKVQGRMNLVNIMSFAETAMTGILVLLTVPHFGTNAAWLGNTWSDIISVAVIVISVFVWRKKVSISVPDLLKVPDDFGAKEGEAAEYSITGMEDVSRISEAVMDFCKSKHIAGKTAIWASLCTEEVTRNILQHGVMHRKQGQISVRIVCGKELTIRVFDDCHKFDPREYIRMFDRQTPEKAIGLRMVAGLASYLDYYNNAGINTLILKF